MIGVWLTEFAPSHQPALLCERLSNPLTVAIVKSQLLNAYCIAGHRYFGQLAQQSHQE